ncbi:NUDIX domain-containing protein [Yoonia sp. SS1-5]|uniref:NUDIX domain-containing protein n=1 Tax=Yoonia rhodophyticola TaxID=3137370 RepID=A0AAN0MCJ9_9RHOB
MIVLREVADEFEILLLRRNRRLAGEWCQIAGAIEDGETASQAALRALKEETGLVPTRFYSGDICEEFYEADRDAITIAPVFVAYVDYDAPVVLNAEHSEYKWISLDWAEDLVPFGGQRRVFRHVRQEFVIRDPSEHLRIALS